MTVDGGDVVSSGVGAACLGSPINAVVWLANAVAERGAPLQAGEVILSGSLGPLVTVERGRDLRSHHHRPRLRPRHLRSLTLRRLARGLGQIPCGFRAGSDPDFARPVAGAGHPRCGMRLDELDRLARRNHGVVSREMSGLGESAWGRAIRAGTLVPVHPKVARLVGTADTPEQRIIAAVLAAGPGVLASHRSAAHLWGVARPVSDPVDIIIPDRRPVRLLDGVVIHRPRDHAHLSPPQRRSGIACTNILRTLCDLGAVDETGVVDAVGHALAARFVSLSALEAALDRPRPTGSARRPSAPPRHRRLVDRRSPDRLAPRACHASTRDELRASARRIPCGHRGMGGRLPRRRARRSSSSATDGRRTASTVTSSSGIAAATSNSPPLDGSCCGVRIAPSRPTLLELRPASERRSSGGLRPTTRDLASGSDPTRKPTANRPRRRPTRRSIGKTAG